MTIIISTFYPFFKSLNKHRMRNTTATIITNVSIHIRIAKIVLIIIYLLPCISSRIHQTKHTIITTTINANTIAKHLITICNFKAKISHLRRTIFSIIAFSHPFSTHTQRLVLLCRRCIIQLLHRYPTIEVPN